MACVARNWIVVLRVPVPLNTNQHRHTGSLTPGFQTTLTRPWSTVAAAHMAEATARLRGASLATLMASHQSRIGLGSHQVSISPVIWVTGATSDSGTSSSDLGA